MCDTGNYQHCWHIEREGGSDKRNAAPGYWSHGPEPSLARNTLMTNIISTQILCVRYHALLPYHWWWLHKSYFDILLHERMEFQCDMFSPRCLKSKECDIRRVDTGQCCSCVCVRGDMDGGVTQWELKIRRRCDNLTTMLHHLTKLCYQELNSYVSNV